MTTAEPALVAADPWDQQLAQLKARYKHVRPPILVALAILLGDANVSIEDAKSRASLRGVRITAASLASARVLLSKMDSPGVTTTPTVLATEPRAPRRIRTADAPIDAEALVRNFVTKLQTQGNAETERLREAMRKAVAVLQAAIG